MITGPSLRAQSKHAYRYCPIAGAAVLAISALLGRPAVAGDGLDMVVTVEIPAQPLPQALLEFGHQARVQVMLAPSSGEGRISTELKGTLRARTALDMLLRGSGLTYQAADNTVTIAPAAAPQTGTTPASASPPDTSQYPSSESSMKPERYTLEEVVVTGSHIRGVGPVGSPTLFVTDTDIEESGASTIDAFMNKLPQIFGGSANQGTQDSSSNSGARANYGYGAGIDIRGLGTGTTLVLLNGHRLAPAGYSGSFVDISMIPTSVIDHVELLLDGASAVYGSDAIGGVANFVLKKDFSGVETSARYGTDTRGVSEERADATSGTRWENGGGLISYEYYSRNPLRAGDRDFASGIGVSQVALLPGQTSNSVFASAHHSFSDGFELAGDALYSGRLAADTFYAHSGTALGSGNLRSWNQSLSTNLALNYTTASDWKLSLDGSYSRTDLSDNTAAIALISQPQFLGEFGESLSSADAAADGGLFDLPGGTVRLAAGAGYRHESSDVSTRYMGSAASVQDAARNIRSGFAELWIPIVGSQNRLPGVSSLELSVAGRYDAYSDFGSASVPKFGLSYSPAPGVTLRGSLGRSFRAPLLQELYAHSLVVLYDAPDPAAAAGKTLTLFNVGSGNARLKPERARDWTVGADYESAAVPIKVNATYYNVSFTDMIANPAFSILDFFPRAAIYGSLITRNPGAAFITSQITGADQFINAYGPYDPAQVGAYVDNRINNIATEDTSGVDFAVKSRIDAAGGKLELSLATTYVLTFRKGITPEADQAAFVNQVGYPVRLRARGGVSWSRGGFGTSAAVNYVNGYTDQLTTPAGPVSSWTTVDMQVRYDTATNGRIAWLDRLRIALTADNVFDKAPPGVPGVLNNYGYDSANASPMGRFLSVQLIKAW